MKGMFFNGKNVNELTSGVLVFKKDRGLSYITDIKNRLQIHKNFCLFEEN